MDALLEAQCQTLGAQQQACALRPLLHAHQLLALQREQALCAAANDLASYQRSGGAGLEPVRAAWLDRVAGRLRLAQSLGDVFGARAAMAEYRSLLDVEHLEAWPSALTAAARAAAPWQARAATSSRAFSRCVHGLLLQRLRPQVNKEHWRDALCGWKDLRLADPELALALRGHGVLPERATLRLPWRGAEASALRSWAGELDSAADSVDSQAKAHRSEGNEDAAEQPEEAFASLFARWRARLEPVDERVGAEWGRDALSAESAIAPWHALARLSGSSSPSLRATARAARQLVDSGQGAAHALEVRRRWVEGGLLVAMVAAPLQARLDELMVRQQVWPQPLLQAHARSLRAGLAAACTETEVELLAAHADACLAIESDWQTLLFCVALAPWHATLEQALPSQAGESFDLSEPLRELLGCAPIRLMQLPLCRSVVTGQLAGAIAKAEALQDAWYGEAGHELLPPLRAWLAVQAAHGRRLPRDGSGLLRALRRLVNARFAGAQASRTVYLHMWGRRASARAWGQLLAEPCRPPMSGWDQGAVTGSLL